MPIKLRSPRVLMLLVGLGVLSALPFLVEDYYVFQLTLVLSTAIGLLGLNLLTGYNGQISLGHGAFYATGAYVTAILMDKAQMAYPLAIAIAGGVSFVFGMLFGFPALRLEGLYLAIATLALGVSLPQILKYKGIEEWTGGVQGITLTKPEAPFRLDLSADQWLYYFTLFVTVLCFFVAFQLLRSHAGRAILAIRDQPIAAAAMGIDVARYKTVTFGISALFTGVAGALTAITVQFVAPDAFSSAVSVTLLVGIVVGGVAQLPGAIYGALFSRFVPMLTEELSKSATFAIYGVILLVVVYTMPYGIAGFVARISARVRASMQRRSS